MVQAIAQLEESSISASLGEAVDAVPQPATGVPASKIGVRSQESGVRGDTQKVSRDDLTATLDQETVPTASVEIVHAVPVRVRLRVPQLLTEQDYANSENWILTNGNPFVDFVVPFIINAFSF